MNEDWKCACSVGLAHDTLLSAEEEQEIDKSSPAYVAFNFCPFCGTKIDRSWQNVTVGNGGECEVCEEEKSQLRWPDGEEFDYTP